jgi:hypothetical protein
MQQRLTKQLNSFYLCSSHFNYFKIYELNFKILDITIDNHIWLLSACAMQCNVMWCEGRIATYKKITSICNGWIEIAWLFIILCTTLVRLLLHYLLCYYEFFWRFLCNLIGMSRSSWFERGSSFSFQNSKMNMGFSLFLISFFLFHWWPHHFSILLLFVWCSLFFPSICNL